MCGYPFLRNRVGKCFFDRCCRRLWSLCSASFGGQTASQSNTTILPFAADVQNASAGVFGSPYVDVQGKANAGGTSNARFTYYFGVNGPSSSHIVTVDIATNMQTIASGGLSNANAYIFVGNNPLTEHVCAGALCNTKTSLFNGVFQYQFIEDSGPQSISLEVDLNSSGATGFAMASIDPFISIDPSTTDAADYSLVFSSNVVNALSSSATPIPATLPLVAGGLGFVGYLAKRRKKTAKQVLAAA